MREARKGKLGLAGMLIGGLMVTSGLNAAAASAKFLYVTNMNQTVRAFAVNATTGALTPVAGGPWIVDEYPFSSASSPGGKFVYSVNPSSTDVAGFAVDPTSGVLTPVPGSPFAMPAGGACCVRFVFHPNGKFAYGLQTAYTIWPFSVNSATGALTAMGNTAQAGVYPTAQIDPSGKFLYTANAGLSFIPDPANTNNISAFSIDPTTGALTQITGSPFATGTDPVHLTTDPSGKFLLVSNLVSKDIRTYSINPATGALTQVGLVATGGSNYDIRFEPRGHFVYVSIGDLKRISVYSFNTGSGALAKVQDVKISGGAGFLAVDPSGKFLLAETFITTSTATTTAVASYTINATTGALALSNAPAMVDVDTGVVGMELSGTAQ
jgi:6-phosphogluconolactonase (cycloisomerase 2 family)